MLLSPMSDLPTIGRRRIYVWTVLLFVVLQVPTALATNAPMFLVFRLLAGVCCAPALATGGATISDMFAPLTAIYGLCLWGAFGILGPVMGPLIGGYVATATSEPGPHDTSGSSSGGWRWTIWVLMWVVAAVCVVFIIGMPETSAANILVRRARRLRAAVGSDRLKSQAETDAASHTWRDTAGMLGRAFTLTFGEPVVFCLDLYTALLYGILYIWFESFPLVFGGVYGFDTRAQGLVFLGILAGALVSVPLYMLWMRAHLLPRLARPGTPPEALLPAAFVGSVALPLCLFWYGWTARPGIHWIVPIVGSAFFTVSIVTLFNPVIAYLGMAYPANSASVFAGNALFRASFAVVFPLFVSHPNRKTNHSPA